MGLALQVASILLFAGNELSPFYRDEARSQLLQSPFFQRWHPDVLTAYIEHGMYETADGNIALKMSPVHETVLFSDTWTGGEEAWVRMHRGELDESIEIRWIFPGRGEVE